ncbi:hypothetical protein BV20DRAFT_146331 [Pilatotrama ljubarskyi]|nr:hypothetical protein BV20DRAFT_146331 [Pilatotrama ljubarskyi]
MYTACTLRRSHPSNISGLRAEKRMTTLAHPLGLIPLNMIRSKKARLYWRASSVRPPGQRRRRNQPARNEERRARNRLLVPLSFALTSLTLCSRRSHGSLPRACAHPSPLDPYKAHHTIPRAGPALRFSCRAGMVKSAGEVQSLSMSFCFESAPAARR